MNILLIRPNIGRLQDGPFIDEARMEPLELGVLGTLTPPEHELTMCDERVETLPLNQPFDLVAISVQIYTARRAYHIADDFRSRGIPVVLGGIHPTLVPDEAAAHADAVVIGDAEGAWAQVLADSSAGCLKKRYQAPLSAPTPPRRELYRGRRYLPISLLQFGRGCTQGCAYCAVTASSAGRHIHREVKEVIQDVEAQDRRNLFFVDDNLVADHQAAKELFKALIPQKIRWVSQASLDMTNDRELMDLMAESGCLGHVIGFESLDPRNLESVGKKVNLPGLVDRYHRELAVLREYGLQTWAAFTLGYEYDTPDSIRNLLDFALGEKFTFAAFNILMPYPGTPFYQTLKDQGRLLYDGTWWLHPAYRFNHAAFVPRSMSPDELSEAGLACRRKFNSPASIFSRVFDYKTNLRSPLRLGLYLAYNPLFRRETFKKQDMLLGSDPGLPDSTQEKNP
ncbi:MAG: radical SAM protein [Spirochaetota bacterium]